MRRLPLRFTVRRLMILIALVACGIGFVQMRSRWILYCEEASRCSRLADIELETAEYSARFALKFDEHAAECSKSAREETRYKDIKESYIQMTSDMEAKAEASRVEAREARERSARYAEMARLYQRAALRPWLSADPEGDTNVPLD